MAPSQPLSAKKTRAAVAEHSGALDLQADAIVKTAVEVGNLRHRVADLEARVKLLEASGTIFDRARWFITGK